MAITLNGTTGITAPAIDATLDAADLTGDVAASQITTALNATGSAPIYACRAWVNFNGTGTVAIRGSGNVSSITDNGTGDYRVNFTTAMPDANYSALTDGNYNINAGNYSDPNGTQIYRTYDASYFGIISRSSGSGYDFAWVTAAVFR